MVGNGGNLVVVFMWFDFGFGNVEYVVVRLMNGGSIYMLFIILLLGVVGIVCDCCFVIIIVNGN